MITVRLTGSTGACTVRIRIGLGIVWWYMQTDHEYWPKAALETNK